MDWLILSRSFATMNQESEREYRSFFFDATGFENPYHWQIRVATEGLPEILPIPTGLGKTEGAVLGWAWRRLSPNYDEPLHLVYCLPMRALVRQTAKRLDACFEALARKRGLSRIPVYRLMGGAIDDGWTSTPDRPWVLVGTQDQLLSRALNRGYTMSRFEWPVHFGLLNQDCHWIVDEVQLMGPGLWTTAQLDWMRRKRFLAVKPCRTTWMSATVGDGFLATSDRRGDGIDRVVPFDPNFDRDHTGGLLVRRAARRPIEWFKPTTGKRAAAVSEQIAARVDTEHCEGTLSLVICNTVNEAQALFAALPDRVPKILLTSRFRPSDRLNYEQQLLDFERDRSKSATGQLDSHPGLICVSTQVVEAGVDISAHRLWSEIAPWPSVIQRLGRLNRDGRGNAARGWFWEAPNRREEKADGEVWIGPYRKRDLSDAKTLINALTPLSPEMPFTKALSALEGKYLELIHRTLQPEAAPLPRALDVHGLFSTERDLHGGFTDVSAFVRNSDPDADVAVFWRIWQGGSPPRGELLDGPPFDPDAEGCPVAFQRLREMLAKQRATAWIWNDEEERWERCATRDLRPGMTIMLHREVGGYNARIGWTGDSNDVLHEFVPAGPGGKFAGDERTEIGSWVSVGSHLLDAVAEAESISEGLRLPGPLHRAIVEAARLHDIGKVHPKWQNALPTGSVAQGGPWAKCPRLLGVDVTSINPAISEAVNRLRPQALVLPEVPNRRGGVRLQWVVGQKLSRKELAELKRLPLVRWAGHIPFRPGMRHEAASALAMWKRYREGAALYPALAVYLAAAHHGKVRTVLRSTAPDGDDVFGIVRDPGSLVIEGTSWPLDFSVVFDGAAGEWREEEFVLTDYGWTGLVADLLGPWRERGGQSHDVGVVPDGEPKSLGPFVLAWLEALVRVADWRASAKPSKSITPGEFCDGR